jgi:DNA polymerase-4/DNA polymerase V
MVRSAVRISDPEYPRAIVHFDGDAFFASVEQMMDWRLRGRPVVTGGERGAATSLSYEAKARGVHRGMLMSEIRRRVPDVVVVRSDYTAYSIFAKRMYAIVRETAHVVEEYSIDECFADITGLDAELGKSYEEIALYIKEQLQTSLGITFGVGLAPSKVLAKAASKYNKPDSFTALPLSRIPDFLAQTSIGSIWGMGGSATLRMMKLGVDTAGQFIDKPYGWLVDEKFAKPYKDIWHELRGVSVRPVGEESVGRSGIGSIMRTRTFTPPSTDRSYVFAQLAQNIEGVCAKARRHGVTARGVSFFLKTQDFQYQSRSIDLPVALNTPSDLIRTLSPHFYELFIPGIQYRATGVTLHTLISAAAVTPDLFGESVRVGSRAKVFGAVDAINRRYGRNTLHTGASLLSYAATPARRGLHEGRLRFLLPIEQRQKALNVPYLGEVL